MSRLLLLFVCLLWMTGAAEAPVAGLPFARSRIAAFLATYAVLVLAVGGWCRLVARRVSARTFNRAARQLGWVVLLARSFVVVWFAAGVFAFGWVKFVQDDLRLDWFEFARLPALVVGTLPAMLAWAGLWWAQYPLDHELRQQSLTENLIDGLPVHAPPTLTAYVASNLRTQLLFTVLPVMLIVGVRDVASFALLPRPEPRPAVADWPRAPRAPAADAAREQGEALIWLLSAGLVFVLAPELLRRILHTSPLPDGPLRRRLEGLCRRSGMRYRDVLVWHTHHNVGNAAVTGLVPRFRYILLSDLLLERMSDEQIAAVFAHEVGHVVHRHMAWYVVFFLTLMLVMLGPASMMPDWFAKDRASPWFAPLSPEAWTLLSLVASAGTFWLLFGFLSRRFERQADVYAARMMEAARPADPAAGADALAPLLGGRDRERRPPRPVPVASHVGSYGANLFASALHRVATINNMPVTPRARRGRGLADHLGHAVGSLTDLAHDWLHGSIPSRMAYLHALSEDPALTSRFDRLMGRLYGAMLFVLIASAAYSLPMLVR